jgi:hypothetical protein
MNILTIVNEFEANYASSFKYTANVKYGIEFKTSIIEDIETNLQLLHKVFLTGKSKSVKVGWEMTIDHIERLQDLLEKIIIEYKSRFKIHPKKMKIYEVNRKIREWELPSPKEFSKTVINEIIIQEKPEKLTKAERLKKEAEAFNIAWAFGKLEKKKR